MKKEEWCLLGESKDEEIKTLYLDGMKQVEIAEALNIRTSMVASRIRIMRKRKVLPPPQKKERCTKTPGLVCLECPYEDCVYTKSNVTKEEKILVREAMKVRQEELINDEYSRNN